MTDARGPEFLPYPLPQRVVAPAAEVVPEQAPQQGRWNRAFVTLSPWGVAALTAAGAAVLALLVVSLLADHRKAGAVLTSLAAALAVALGARALQDEQPEDGKTVVKTSTWAAVVAAVVSLLLLLGNGSTVAEQPPVQVPSPPPAAVQPTPSPLASPQPGTSGAPTPDQGAPPPGSDEVFGIPSDPGPPTAQDPAATGVLTGRVVTTSGTAVPGALVTITRTLPGDTSDSPGCPLKVTARTDAKGRYTVKLCQLGDNLGYHVVISAGGASASTDLFINSGRTTVYNVILAIRHA